MTCRALRTLGSRLMLFSMCPLLKLLGLSIDLVNSDVVPSALSPDQQKGAKPGLLIAVVLHGFEKGLTRHKMWSRARGGGEEVQRE